MVHLVSTVRVYVCDISAIVCIVVIHLSSCSSRAYLIYWKMYILIRKDQQLERSNVDYKILKDLAKL